MSTIQDTTELRPATAKRQVYSPLETYWETCWNAFQEWRKREKLRTELCRLTDSELDGHRYHARRDRLRRLKPLNLARSPPLDV